MIEYCPKCRCTEKLWMERSPDGNSKCKACDYTGPHTDWVREAAAPPHPLMQFFEFTHLPSQLQIVSKQFHWLAEMLDRDLPENAEKTFALRSLLQAKDYAVRAVLFK